MAEGIEIGFVGKITYFTIVVYLLFIFGLIIVCRQQYKSRQGRRRKKSLDDNQAVDSRTEQCNNTEMGLFQSKKRGGYQVNKTDKVTKRNITKNALQHGDRPVSSGSKNGEIPADDNDHRNKSADKGKCNKNTNDSTQISDIQSVEKLEKALSGINVSTDRNGADNEKETIQEITDDRPVSVQQKIVIKENDSKETDYSEIISSENMGRPTTQRSVDPKYILSSIEVKQTAKNGTKLIKKNVSNGSDMLSKPSCTHKTAAKEGNIGNYAENMLANVLDHAYHDLNCQLGGLKDLAESVIESSMIDVMSHVNDHKVLNNFAAGLVSRTIDDSLKDEDIVRMKSQPYPKPNRSTVGKLSSESSKLSSEPSKLSSEPSKLSSEPPKLSSEPSKLSSEPSKLSSEPSKLSPEPSKLSSESSKLSPEPSKLSSEPSKLSSEPSKKSKEKKNFILIGKCIENIAEELSYSIVDNALDTVEDMIYSLEEENPIGQSNTSESFTAGCQKGNSSQLHQENSLNDLSDSLTDRILRNSLEEIDLKAKATQDLTPHKQKSVILNQPCENSIVPLIRPTESGDIDKGLSCEIVEKVAESDANEKGCSDEESVNMSVDSEVGNENEEKSPQKPVMLRNKNLLKVKVHTDRPLSGYAEQLASFLADDDDSLDLFESDEEFDAVLGKMEEKYRDDKKLSLKIQRRRRTSDSRKKDAYGTANGLFSKKFDGNSSNEDLFEEVERSRLASTQSDSSFLSDTDTDELLKGSMSDDQLLSPGFSKFAMKTTAVIDTGCGILKAGMAGEITPRCILPSVIGVPRRFSQDLSQIGRGYYVGDEAIFRAGMLQIDHPIKQNVTNWSDVNSLLEYVMEVELGINIRDHPLLLTENGLISKKQREKITEIIFERHGAPAFFLANQGPLSLYSQGLMSGLCVNAGFCVTQSIPVYEGHGLDYCTRQLDIGGHQISNHLGRRLLSTKGLAFSTSSEKFILNQIKERIGYVAEDPKLEQDRFRKNPDDVRKIYTLPDGQEIEIDVERFKASEILFDPEEIGLEQKPIQSMIMESIANANNSLQSTLTNHVVVTGGTSLLPGFTKRLEKELNALTEHTTTVRLTNASNPITATWTGGSVISSRSTFSQQCITTDQYAEVGASVVHMKCF